MSIEVSGKMVGSHTLIAATSHSKDNVNDKTQILSVWGVVPLNRR